MSNAVQHVVAVGLLLLAIATGGYLRLAHLSAYDLTQDELSLYYVGQSLADGRPPVLPSGRWYERGTDYARLVELAQRRIEAPEIASRLPSALIGTLCVALMAAGTWMVAGPWAAVGGTILLAVYPDAVIQSRIGRFYMLQLLFGLVALFGGWLFIRNRTVLSKAKAWIAVSAVTLALLIAADIQVTALPSLIAWWLCLTVIGAWDVRRGSVRWQDSIPFLFSIGTLLVLAVLIILDPTLPDKLVVRALSMPLWARVRDASPFMYLRQWLADFSILAVLAPLGFTRLLVHSRAPGAYLFIMFAVPAFVFSVLLPFKAERFLLLALPPMFIAAGIAAASLGRALHSVTSRFLERRSNNQQVRRLAAVLVVALAAVLAAGSTRAVRTAGKGYWSRTEPDWQKAGEILNSRNDLIHIPVGATKSLPPLFYWSRLHFNVGRNYLEQWSFSPLADAGVVSGRVGAYVTLPIGTPDLYAGVPVLTTPESIRERFGSAEAVIVAIDGQAQYFAMVDPALKETLAREGEELCRWRCGSLWVYLWRFGGGDRVTAP